MRIRAHDHLSGFRQSLLDHNLMADARTCIEEVLHPVLLNELPDLFMIGSGLLARCRDHMIENDYRQSRIHDPVFIKLGPDLSDYCRRIIMGEQMIRAQRYDLSGHNMVQTSLSRQYLLYERFTHSNHSPQGFTRSPPLLKISPDMSRNP